MSKTLSADTQAEMAKTATKPRTVLKIEFPTAGTKYYSDQSLTIGALSVEDHVVSWGALSLKLDIEASASTVAETSIELRDDDKTLLGYLSAEDFQRVPVTVYQWFEISGHDATDLTPLLQGIINSPVEWLEDSGTLRLEITDISLYREQTVGLVATREMFPKIADEDEDAILPLVYGNVRAARTINVAHGAVTELATRLDYYDTEVVVRDASRFPQGTTIRLWVDDDELIEGSFDGNKLTISERGYIIYSGMTTAVTGDPWQLEDSNLTSIDFKEIWGRPILIEDPNYGPQWRWVMGKASATRIYIDCPVLDSNGVAKEVDFGTPFTIRGRRRNHEPGTIVREALDEYKWIANVRPSEEIIAVEAFGAHATEDLINTIIPWERFGFHREVQRNERWAPLPEEAYDVDLDEDLGITGLDHVTTITMNNLPSTIGGGKWTVGKKYSRDTLRVWIKGTKSGGSYLTNPADVIEDVLKEIMGLGAGDVDIPAATVTALSDLAFGFSLDRQMPALQFLAELGFQCRSSLVWEATSSGPVAKLRPLANAIGSSVLTIDNTKRELGGLLIERTPLGDVVTEVRATYLEAGEQRHVTVSDATAESNYGRRSRTLDLWAYSARSYVHYMAQWWLDRWKRIWDGLKVVAWLDALEVERGDWITVNVPSIVTSEPAFVVGIDQRPGSGVDGEPDRIELELALAYCASSCQLACELSGCESYCEIVAATISTCWKCETSCENVCELLSCVTGTEVICKLNCLIGCMVGGVETDYEGCSTDMPTCSTQCTTFSCESGSCETGCETTCETGCQTGGEGC